MKIFSSSAGPIFLLATSALHPTVNSFPIESTTSILPSDAYSTSPKDHTLLSKLEGSYIANNSVETLNHFLKKLNDSLTLSQKLYEEDSFSNTLDDDSFKPFDNLPEWKKYNTKYPPLNTSAESTITAETDSTATPLEVTSSISEESTITAEINSTATPLEVTSTTSAESTITAETNSTVSSTASSQEQNSNQGLWSYSIALGLTIIGAATMLIKNKFCSNETQEESNKEMDTFDLSDFLTPVNNVTLELDNVALMAEPTEDTQA
ncbi:MAG TPA: hypothetical protein LFW13_02770 [Rickettsia endosymbiont of Sericostoma sp.]|nr:hypothetical protein [Rickettsia endosymbiont of Sericostoma sp.]